MAKSELTKAIIKSIKGIPFGKVSTYGAIARMAGNPRGARQVVRVLHTFSESENLPWHRVINREGRVSERPIGAVEQRYLLDIEGVFFDSSGRVDLDEFLWTPEGP